KVLISVPQREIRSNSKKRIFAKIRAQGPVFVLALEDSVFFVAKILIFAIYILYGNTCENN
ncbi:MAG: hypothetical protein Q7S60_02630, partial [bacterium]|nr:hypothetical protein [bacterium]